MLPFTLVTGAVYVTGQVLQLKLVTQVELVRYPASLVKSDTFVGIVGIAQPSLIFLPVVPSNTARCPSVELLGHTTSQDQLPPPPSCQSCTSKLKGSHSSKFIVTVVVFQTFVLVTLVIQFQSLPSSQSSQSFHGVH